MTQRTTEERAIRAANDLARICVSGASASSAYATKVAEFSYDYALRQARWLAEASLAAPEVDCAPAFENYDTYVRQMILLPIEFAHQFSVDAQGVVHEDG